MAIKLNVSNILPDEELIAMAEISSVNITGFIQSDLRRNAIC